VKRVFAAIVVAVAAGELAVWLLRPEVNLDPRAVSESSYFSHAQLARAHDFSGPQRLLALGAIGAQLGLLVFLVVRPPRRTIARIEHVVRGRKLAAGAVAGSALALSLTVAGLPFAAAAHRRAVDFDLSTQGWGGWISDTLKSGAIGALLAGGAAALALALMRRFGRRWWIAGTAAVIVLEVVFVWLAPVVLAPLFNRYEELPQGQTRSQLIELAREQGVDVDKVLVVDASRRTNAVNAYVTGLGHTKRIVLYDTLLDSYTPAQTRLVVAHELGHVKQRDIVRGLAWSALYAPAGMYLVMLLTARWSRRGGSEPGSPGSLPALALALTLVAGLGVVVSNQLSRRVEARADQFALVATGEPRSAIELERRLAVSNLSDPSPPALLHDLLGTHPTAVERIGAALRYEREHPGPPGDR
jgi:STE24 endopeptidase